MTAPLRFRSAMSAHEPPPRDAAALRFRMPDLPPQHCWHCQHFGEMCVGGAAARCARRGAVHIQSAPAHGCVYWEREPGSDDEPGPPETRDGSRPPPLLPPPCERGNTRAPGLQGRGHNENYGAGPDGHSEHRPPRLSKGSRNRSESRSSGVAGASLHSAYRVGRLPAA